jgi:hypothetical protein
VNFAYPFEKEQVEMGEFASACFRGRASGKYMKDNGSSQNPIVRRLQKLLVEHIKFLQVSLAIRAMA